MILFVQMKISLPDEDSKTIDVDVKSDKVRGAELIVYRNDLGFLWRFCCFPITTNVSPTGMDRSSQASPPQPGTRTLTFSLSKLLSIEDQQERCVANVDFVIVWRILFINKTKVIKPLMFRGMNREERVKNKSRALHLTPHTLSHSSTHGCIFLQNCNCYPILFFSFNVSLWFFMRWDALHMSSMQWKGRWWKYPPLAVTSDHI